MRLDFESSAAVEDFDYADANSFAETSTAERSQKFQAGALAAREGRRAEARLLLLEAAGEEPNGEDVWLYLASVSEYPEELLVFLKNALRINPANEEARERVAATEKILAKNFSERGENAFDAKQEDFARQCYRQALAFDAENETALLGLARGTDSDQERREIYERVLNFNPENETAAKALAGERAQNVERLLARAAAEAFAEDFAAAEDTLDEIFACTPDNEEAWLLRGFLASSFDEKTECWETILRVNPKNKLARAGIAQMRVFKSKLIAPLEKELEARLDAHVAELENEENKSSADVENSQAENSFDAAPLYAEYSSVEPETTTEIMTDSEVCEIADNGAAAAAADAPDYYEIEEEVFTTIPPAAANYAAPAEMGDARFDAAGENQMSEQFSNGGDGKSAREKADEEDAASKIACPFCSRENAPQTFVCPSCMAVLTLSDLEMLLAHADANREIVRQAVERMEAEKDFNDFGADELKILGIGQINLRHLRDGFLYLREAVQINPNDVVLSAQVNALAIRLAEIEAQKDTHSTMPKNKTILVVDDSATVRKLISGKLEKSGHAVLCAVDGIDALEKIEALVPDLILLDINMPRMDGYTVCKMIRTNEKTKDIPVVMISGKDGFFDKVRGRMAGTTGYITKPFGPETLMKTVENYIV